MRLSTFSALRRDLEQLLSELILLLTVSALVVENNIKMVLSG